MAQRAQKDKVNIHEAKTNLSRLIERVEAGAEITIARNGTPVARLVPVEKRFPVKLGLYSGQIEIVKGPPELPEDFDELDEIARSFYEVDPDDPMFQDPDEWVWPSRSD